MTATALRQPEASPKLLTYEEYLTEGTVEGYYEIIDGVRVPYPGDDMAGAEWRHQRINGHIFNHFSRYEEEIGQGKAIIAPFDVVIRRIPRLQTRQPDVLYISNARLAQCPDPDNPTPLEIGPELVVEVLSPSETLRSIQSKVDDYQSIGVEECWLVSPQAETVQILRLFADRIEDAAIYTRGQTAQSLVFPDLRVALAHIFAL